MRYRICRNHCQHWDLHPDLLLSTLMLFTPFDPTQRIKLPQISPSVPCHGLWASHCCCSFPRGDADFDWMKAWYYLKGWLVRGMSQKERGVYLASTARSWNTEWLGWKYQAPGSRMQWRKKAKEDPEDEVRKKRGTGKGPNSYQAPMWGEFCLFLPKEATIWQEAKLRPKSRLAGFKYICGYIYQISTPQAW